MGFLPPGPKPELCSEHVQMLKYPTELGMPIASDFFQKLSFR